MNGVTLGPEELVADRPFTDPDHTVREGQVMREMLHTEAARVREWAGGERPEGDGIVVRERYETGRRCLLIVPDVSALVEAPDVAAVGFFGQRARMSTTRFSSRSRTSSSTTWSRRPARGS